MKGDTDSDTANKRERDSDSSPSPRNESKKRPTMSKETDSQKIDRILATISGFGGTLNAINNRVINLEATSNDLMRKLEKREAEWAVEREELVQKCKTIEARLN